MIKNAVLTLVLAAFALAACPKEQKPAEPAADDKAAAAEPKKEEPKAADPVKAAEPTKADEPKKEEGAAAAAGAGDADKDCGALYDFIDGMKKALTAKLGPGKASKPMPPREKFVEACKVLPGAVVRCMNPKTQMAEPKQCQEALMNAEKNNQDAIAKFKSLMK